MIGSQRLLRESQPGFSAPLTDPLEEAEILAFHVGYERGVAQRPILTEAEARAEIEQDVWEWVMVG
jgi:hypothetical protein